VAGPRRHRTGFPVTPVWAPAAAIRLSKRSAVGRPAVRGPDQPPFLWQRRRQCQARPRRRPATWRCRKAETDS